MSEIYYFPHPDKGGYMRRIPGLFYHGAMYRRRVFHKVPVPGIPIEGEEGYWLLRMEDVRIYLLGRMIENIRRDGDAHPDIQTALRRRNETTRLKVRLRGERPYPFGILHWGWRIDTRPSGKGRWDGEIIRDWLQDLGPHAGLPDSHEGESIQAITPHGYPLTLRLEGVNTTYDVQEEGAQATMELGFHYRRHAPAAVVSGRIFAPCNQARALIADSLRRSRLLLLHLPCELYHPDHLVALAAIEGADEDPNESGDMYLRAAFVLYERAYGWDLYNLEMEFL